jgi:hypothetical protein
MSHLDTAYQLGVKKAEEDFQAELAKSAQGYTPGGTVPGAPTVPTPVNPQVGKGIHNQPPPSRMPAQKRVPPTPTTPPPAAPVR